LSAQVGINTDDPQGLLHVDAKGDTNGSLNTDDDVVITPEGRIGVGTLSPLNRLDIHGTIRIADGTQGDGKILMSDADGVAKWTNIAGSWYAALTKGESIGTSDGTGTTGWPAFKYTSSELSPPGKGSVNRGAGTIKVPYTGTYRITINGIGYTNRTTDMYIAYLSVLVNAVPQFNPHLHAIKSLGTVDFGFMILLPLNANDVVKMEPMPTGNYHANAYRDTRLHIEFVK
jgi:hypothetical protein